MTTSRYAIDSKRDIFVQAHQFFYRYRQVIKKVHAIEHRHISAHLFRLVNHALAGAAQVLHKRGQRLENGGVHVHVFLVRDVLVVHDVG